MSTNQSPSKPNPVEFNLSLQEIIENNVKPYLKSYFVTDKVIDRILNKGTRILYSKYLRSKLPKHTSDYFFNAFKELIEQEKMLYDPGENIDSLLFNWAEDEEPEACPLDSWSVYTIPMKRAVPSGAGSQTIDSVTSLDSVTIGGNRHARYRNSLRRNSRKSTKSTDLNHITEQTNYRSQEFDLKFEKMEQVKEVEDKGIEKIREELEKVKKKRQQKIEEELKEVQRQKDLQEKIKNFEKQKKENGYTFDYEGNIILVKTKHVPSRKDPIQYDLNGPEKIIPKISENPLVRTLKEDERKTALSLVSLPKSALDKTQQLSHTSQFRDMIDIRPGVKLEMFRGAKVGPEYKDEKKMRKDDYLKLLEDRKQDDRKTRRQLTMKKIQEESTDGEQRKKEGAENAIRRELNRLSELGHPPEIEIHQQEKLIEMVMHNTDSTQKKLADLKKAIKNKENVPGEKPNIEQNAKQGRLETRVVAYNQTEFSELKGQTPRVVSKSQPKVPVNKLQVALDNFNKNLLVNDWEKPHSRLNSANPAAKAIPKVSQEQKTNLKASIFEGHIPKEPRERTTIGQKRVIKDRNMRISLDSPGSAITGNPLTARGPDTQSKVFIIKTSRAKDKPADLVETKAKKHVDSIEAEKTKPKGEPNTFRLKSSASVTTLTGSIQTSRPRMNG